MELLAESMQQLEAAIEEASQLGERDPHCAALATATPDGKPSVRTVFIERIEPTGLVFCVHVDSGKARQMLANPRVGVSFYWKAAEQQANIEGEAILLSEEESDGYWATRSRESQLGAWASTQPEPLKDADDLKQKLDDAKQQFSFERVPRPENWRAFRLRPQRVEFWRSNWRRLRGRVRYHRDDDGRWHLDAYQP